MSKQVDEYILRLERRKKYLEQTAQNNHFAKSELATLEWAIAYIKATPLESATHQQIYFKNKKERKDESKIYPSSNDTNDTIR